MQEYHYTVTFENPVNGKRHYCFCGLAAIYETLTEKQIGCKVENLYKYKIKVSRPFKNRECIISKEPLGRKKRKLTFKMVTR